VPLKLVDDGLVRLDFPEPWGGMFVGRVVTSQPRFGPPPRLVGEVTDMRVLPERGDVIRVPAIDGDVAVIRAELDIGGLRSQRSCRVESRGSFAVGGVRILDNGTVVTYVPQLKSLPESIREAVEPVAEELDLVRLAARELAVLCRRANVMLAAGDVDNAKSLLGYACRIAASAGIEPVAEEVKA
jgi:hypothetical protein